MSVSKAEFDAYVRSMQTLSDGAQRALMRLWGVIDTSSTEAMKRDLLNYVPAIVERFGKASAVISARFYDKVRESSDAGGEYYAITADNSKFHEIERDIRYALGDEFTGASATAFIAATVDRSVKQFGRETMALNASQDSGCTGYVSVPSGDACAFCIMKAIGTYRNYLGEKLEVEVDGEAWHDHCNCQLLPFFDSTPYWWRSIAGDCEDMYNAGVKMADKIADEGRRVQQLDELHSNPAYQRMMANPKTRSHAVREEAKIKYELSAQEVLAGMRKANGIEH